MVLMDIVGVLDSVPSFVKCGMVGLVFVLVRVRESVSIETDLCWVCVLEPLWSRE